MVLFYYLAFLELDKNLPFPDDISVGDVGKLKLLPFFFVFGVYLV